jgi:hypothetical protein
MLRLILPALDILFLRVNTEEEVNECRSRSQLCDGGVNTSVTKGGVGTLAAFFCSELASTPVETNVTGPHSWLWNGKTAHLVTMGER